LLLDGETEELGETLGLLLLDGLTDEDGLTDGETEDDGETDGESLEDGETDGLSLGEATARENSASAIVAM
jgi:hypothetical protein